MSPNEAKRVLEALANGIDPETGEVLHGIRVLDYPTVIRALFLGAKALESASVPERQKSALASMAGKPWTEEEESELLRGFDAGQSIEQLSAEHGRSKGGIAARLVRLGRIEERSEVYSRGQRTID